MPNRTGHVDRRGDGIGGAVMTAEKRGTQTDRIEPMRKKDNNGSCYVGLRGFERVYRVRGSERRTAKL